MRFIAASSGSSWFQLSKGAAVNANTRRDATRRDTTRDDTTRREKRPSFFLLGPQVSLYRFANGERTVVNLDFAHEISFFSFVSTFVRHVESYRLFDRIVSMSSLGGIDLDGSINGLFKIIVTMTLWIIGYRRCIEPCKIRLWKSSSDFDANLIGILVQTRKPNLRSVNSKGFESIDSNELMLAMLGFAAVIGER